MPVGVTGPFTVTGASEFVHVQGKATHVYDGVTYQFAMDAFNAEWLGNPVTIGVWKSTDGETWTGPLDQVNEPSCFSQDVMDVNQVPSDSNDTRVAAICRDTSNPVIYVAFQNVNGRLQVAQFDMDTETWGVSSVEEPTNIPYADPIFGTSNTTWPMAISHDGINIHVLWDPIVDVDGDGQPHTRVAYNRLTGGIGGAWEVLERVPDQQVPQFTGELWLGAPNWGWALWSIPGTGRVHCLLSVTDIQGPEFIINRYLVYWQVGAAATAQILVRPGDVPGSISPWVISHKGEFSPVVDTAGEPVYKTFGGDTYMVIVMNSEGFDAGEFAATWNLELVYAVEDASPVWMAEAIPDGRGVYNSDPGPRDLYKTATAALFEESTNLRVIYRDGNQGTGLDTLYMVSKTWTPVGGLSVEPQVLLEDYEWQWLTGGSEVSSFWIFYSTVSPSPDPWHYNVLALLFSGGVIPPSIIVLRGGGVASQICQQRNAYDDCLDYEVGRNEAVMAVINYRRDAYGAPPPWVQIPFDGERFQKRGSIVLPPDNGVDNLVLQFRVPLGYNGTIITITNQFNGLGFIAGNGDIEWRVQINEYYLKDQGRILINRGNLRHPYALEGGGYRVFSNNTVRMLVAITPGAAARLQPGARIVCALSGWFYPQERENENTEDLPVIDRVGLRY